MGNQNITESNGGENPRRPAKPLAKGKKRKTKKANAIESKPDSDSNWDEQPQSEITELPTANLKLPTETMEVHHHPDVEKKTFKQYLLEGLMIFLAVFMGFIAENIRERIADNGRETQYMASLVKDLKLDTAILSRAAVLKEQRMLAIDSVLAYFRNNINAKKVPLPVFREMRRSQWDMFFMHHNGAIDQLKNSGGLRLIRNKGIVDSIEFYYQRVQRSESRNTMYFDNQQVSDALSEKLWDAYDNIKYNQDYIFAHKALPGSGSISVNTAYLNEYLNNLIRVKWITFADRRQFTIELRDNANRLIALIKKAYRLDE